MNNQEEINFPEFQREQLIEAASKLYNEKLKYHNFEHAQNTIEVSQEIIERCKKENLEVDEDVIYYALLFHDAGYFEDPQQYNFKNKEEYSAYLAREEMEKIGISNELIEKVVNTIMATHSEALFTTVEQKIVRASDLSGLSDDYETFLENNNRLKDEFEMLEGKEISINKWKLKTKEVVEFYLSQDIRLTKGYEDEEGNSLFHKKAKENLERFLNE